MSKTRTLFATGVLIAILPYLGFPYFWKNILFAILGLGISVFAYMLHREERKGEEDNTYDNFSENSDFKSIDGTF